LIYIVRNFALATGRQDHESGVEVGAGRMRHGAEDALVMSFGSSMATGSRPAKLRNAEVTRLQLQR
jgi:hypothetical protein